MTARAPVYIDSGKLHVFEDGDTLPPWLSPSSMAWENLTGVPVGLTELAALTGPGYAKLDSAGAWSVQAAIPLADVSGLTTALAGLQPLSARLTSIAGLTDAAGWLHDDGSGNWALTTPTKSDVGLSLVENTALSTWGGSANLATLGTVTTGVWHGTAIADAYISSAATWNAKEGGLGNPSTSGYLLSSTSAGVRSWVAPYSLPTATASVLGGVKVGTGLAISSGVLSVAYGTAAGTACAGNDSRLSDSRTPTAHALDGALHTIGGKTAGQALVATSATAFGFTTVSGDATLSGAGALTLATLLTAGSAGSAAAVPTLTWDAKGRLTAVGSAAISIPHTQINDWAINTTPAAIGALPSLLQSGAVDFNSINSNLSGAYTIFGTTSYSHAPSGLGANGGGGMLWQGYGANYIDWGAQVFVDAQQDILWYRTQGAPATWRAWHQLLTGNQNISLTGAVTGSGTTSIVTTFANTHLAGINQDLTTTSSPTFASITANLAGHASLDIPLTGSSAITGSLISSNASNLGSVSLPWGSVYGTTLYEGGVALSSKYLGISASIPYTQISDWGTYINQPVLTTSQPTFSGGVRSAGTYDILSTVSGNSDILTARLSQGSLLLRNTTGAFAQFSVNADLYSPTVYLTSSISGYYPNFNVSGNITASTLSVGNTSTFTGLITANGGITSPQYSLPNLNAAPASSTSTGTYGEIRWCDGYVYLCTATNTWKRAALTTW